VATERNNTVDGLLLLLLLLAAWAVLRSVRTGRLRYLLLGAVLVGLGVNIKMLQAFLPLPALILVYLLGAPHRWLTRVGHLVLAAVLLAVVSLSWAIVVDLTPPEERPYVGSSTNNTVMELIVGHNGLKRLALSRLFASTGSGQAPLAGQGGPQQPGGPGPQPRPPFSPPAPNQQPGQGQGPPPGQRPGGPSQEVGQAGLLRLFTKPLVTEASWLLPAALLGIPLLGILLGWRWPLGERRIAWVLWAGWLLPEVLYFTFNSGLFHGYYLIMLGPPLAALVGATAWALWQVRLRRPWLGWTLIVATSGLTLVLQIATLLIYRTYALWALPAALAWCAGVGMLLVVTLKGTAKREGVAGRSAGDALLLAGLFLLPTLWSALTALNPNPNVALPASGPSLGREQSAPSLVSMRQDLSPQQRRTLAYLLVHADPEEYLVATLDAHGAAPYILTTTRPVLTFGGFSGGRQRGRRRTAGRFGRGRRAALRARRRPVAAAQAPDREVGGRLVHRGGSRRHGRQRGGTARPPGAGRCPL